MKVPFVLFILIFLIACGVPQADYDKLVQRADSLQAELDEANIELADIKSGPEMQLNEAKKYIAADNFEAAKLILEALMVQYPTSPQAIEANQIFADLNARENPGQAIDTKKGE
jgi:hypothetical protein